MSSSTLELVEEPRSAPPIVADPFAASVVLLLGMTVMQRLIGFLRGVLFCRFLDPEQIGLWDVAFSFMNLAAPLAVLGLPGSFGRYLDYFRLRQQLRPFLNRTAVLCLITGMSAVAGIALARPFFSQLIFGSYDQQPLVLYLAACLITVIANNFVICIFMAARMYRVVTALQFVQGLMFALVSVALCLTWQPTAASAVVGYALASLLCVAASYPYLRMVWRSAPPARATPDNRAFWGKLLPFAAWVWLTNLLTNVFDIIDRYMIVHFSGLQVDEALRQVGYYHSSRLVPLLIVAVASLLGTMITPHLSHDWEEGRRGLVVLRLNTFLKSLMLALYAGSVVVMFLGPWLFNFALGGKFADGLAQLPWTLAYCAWFGAIPVAQNYLWCAEKARLGSFSIFIGLLVNIVLDLLLLPPLGLRGAVLATTAANCVALVLVCAFSTRLGMRWQWGTWILLASPALLWFGPWGSAVALVVLLAVAAGTELLFTREEKQYCWHVARRLARKLQQSNGRGRGSAIASSKI